LTRGQSRPEPAAVSQPGEWDGGSASDEASARRIQL
jgi:hypothetical protein